MIEKWDSTVRGKKRGDEIPVAHSLSPDQKVLSTRIHQVCTSPTDRLDLHEEPLAGLLSTS